MKDTEKIVTALHLAPQLDINKMIDEIFVLRQKTINTAIMQQLQNLMHEKGITELYAIDESKVMQLIKEHQALEIIKKNIKIKVDYSIGVNRNSYFIETQEDVISITEEEYKVLKGVLYENISK